MRLSGRSVRPTVAAAILLGGGNSGSSIGSMIPSLLSLKTSSSSSMLFAAAMSTSTTNNNDSSKKAALIFLHGLGDSPAGWSSLQSALPSLRPRLSQLKYVFPPAPTIPISINGGMPMPGWFDLYDWPIGIGVRDDKAGLKRSVEQIEAIATKLEEEDGIERSRIVVGGFSQGGAIALLAAYRDVLGREETQPFAACAALSAWVTLPDDDRVGWKGGNTPLFWGHGSYDDKVLFEQQKFGIEKLQQKASLAAIKSSDYPMGHESDPEEIGALAKFLDQILYGKDTDSNQEL